MEVIGYVGGSMEAIGQGGQWRRQGRGVNGGDRVGGQWRR